MHILVIIMCLIFHTKVSSNKIISVKNSLSLYKKGKMYEVLFSEFLIKFICPR